MGNAELEHVITRLEAILVEVWDEHPGGEPIDRDASFLNLGVDSLTLVHLLDRIESDFHPEWDPDNPPSAFSSLLSLAGSMTTHKPDGTARK
ncbi:acyl carrier protein [Streptomyces sp. NPDC001816]|uniref:acyl carrier protein n=1 Tax=Streptomyces sp. NPDC001816 TaxID=3364612 RepID=UPI00369A4F71